MRIGLLALIIITQCMASFGQTHLKLTLDTKQMLNPDCNLNGGVVADDKVYIHAGLCTSNEIFCMQAITPYESEVWEHVVGNWGAAAADDSIGIMTYEGNGIWSWEIEIESYFSDPNLVDLDSSTLMPAGATPYTMGIVFRDKEGDYSGRDDGCNDLFITHLSTDPVVVQSTDLSNYNAITVEKTTGIKENKVTIVDVNAFPNPFKDETTISYYLTIKEKLNITIYNTLGQEIITLVGEEQSIGQHSVSFGNEGMNSGLYYYSIMSEGVIMFNGMLVKE